jgi:hypothetical protein
MSEIKTRKYPPPQLLFEEFQWIAPPDMDDSMLVELAWGYGLSPDVIQRAYIQFLDGVS